MIGKCQGKPTANFMFGLTVTAVFGRLLWAWYCLSKKT